MPTALAEQEPTEPPEGPPQAAPLAPPRHTRRWLAQLPLTLVCLLLGALGAALWRIDGGRVGQDGLEGQSKQPNRAEILAQQLADSDAKLEEMRREIEQLRQSLKQYETAAAKDQSLAKEMHGALQQARIAAGLTAVEGPGIVVTLEDAALRAGAGEDQSPYVIHDVDLLQIVNELRAAGAEAIALNGQRLTATSELRCSGGVVRVNGISLVPPFDVRAIGSAKALAGALNLPGGVMEILRKFEIAVNVTLKSKVELPAADVAQSFRYLRVADVKPDQ
ncbi:MAG: hypothetical protein COZ06_09890 [Armatimonadetes bacterium CG_4_10_14_3_um_filter_66_18]|nr:DUF881 domain-containing protein [Armatimonadota bacterium]PIU90215.1 MAG: hypothetical protein COS65_25955 [Armatimonadetes bacterium CG06_land_8_20_14_3_00_66_21]PIW13619.1 MAG: hypothetical protein COW34_08560 [Armatimonadetes bacterium CG17_big_fil_post_rev_8_21_14_2_50_66_6]PIX46043.1 MAG: hypothetical protein COZ57_13710 [Armatimonadetes bacterium CG_4_8_14_3_um_filter_66_20]PIY50320.1 MAG: hypothetical protein COZ06_09890 [Armatimonadetes bacterium CG_4_10_14_3_um_filter_66_18]PIZ431